MMKGERSLNTLSTHEATLDSLFNVRMWGDHKRSLDRRTPRSRTDLAGSMPCPSVVVYSLQPDVKGRCRRSDEVFRT